MAKEILPRTERFGAVAGSLSIDTRDGIRFRMPFLVLKFPASGGELVAYVQALIKAKGHKGHYYRHDLLTPLPLD